MRPKALAAAVALLMAGVLLHPAGSRAQQTPSIKITSPANGATVNAPVSVTVDITGVTVKPASAGDPDAYHYHLFVDVDPATVVQPGQPIPTGQANIIHTADQTVNLPDLTPGPHTVYAVLTKTNHVPLNPSVQDKVQFTVAGGAAGGGGGQPSTPRVGTGVAGPGAALPVWGLPLVLIVLGAGAWLARRRSA
jgi:hypothetical protein